MTILEKLTDKRIFSLRYFPESKKYVITEECDHYFDHEMTLEDLNKWIDELIEFRDKHSE